MTFTGSLAVNRMGVNGTDRDHAVGHDEGVISVNHQIFVLTLNAHVERWV